MNERDSSFHNLSNKLSINKSFQEKPQDEDEYEYLSLSSLPRKKNYSGKYHYVRDFSIEEAMTTVFFRKVHHGSLTSSIFCMICVTLGTGMLPIPHLFSSNGLILTFILYLFFSLPTYKTMQMLIKMSHNNKLYNFPELVSKYFGNNSFMTKLTIISLLINSFGCIILWNVYINKFSVGLISFFQEDYATTKHGNYICIIILMLIQIPLAIYNKGNEFDLMATVGVLQIIYVLVVLIIEFPSYTKEFYDKKIFFNIKTYFNNNIFEIMEIPFVLFISFGNHSTILSVVEQIKTKTTKRVLKVGKYTFFGEFIVYIYLVLICFFSTFSHTNDNDVFLIRPKITFLMTLGQFFMVILMVCNISLYYFTTLPTLEFIFNKNEEFSKDQNIIAAILMLSLLTLISFFISNLGEILTFLGIFAQVSLIFIIPISLYLKAKENEITLKNKILYIFALVFYSILGIVGFFFMIFNKRNEE
jgi:amino acid permease